MTLKRRDMTLQRRVASPNGIDMTPLCTQFGSWSFHANPQHLLYVGRSLVELCGWDTK
jgi:hypothetical protein